MGTDGTYLNIIKAIYGKCTANTTFNCEKLKVVPLVLATAIRKKKEKIQIGREEVKLSLYADDVILHIENPKDSVQKLFAVSYSKVGYKFNI